MKKIITTPGAPPPAPSGEGDTRAFTAGPLGGLMALAPAVISNCARRFRDQADSSDRFSRGRSSPYEMMEKRSAARPKPARN